MKWPVCDTEILYQWIGFDSLRIIAQCPNHPYYFFFPIETLLKKPLLEIVVEREERIRKKLIPELAPALKKEYPNAILSMVLIDSGEAKRVASIGSRIAFSVVDEITNGELEYLNNKYAMTIRIIQKEIGYEKREFKRRII